MTLSWFGARFFVFESRVLYQDCLSLIKACSRVLSKSMPGVRRNSIGFHSRTFAHADAFAHTVCNCWHLYIPPSHSLHIYSISGLSDCLPEPQALSIILLSLYCQSRFLFLVLLFLQIISSMWAGTTLLFSSASSFSNVESQAKWMGNI